MKGSKKKMLTGETILQRNYRPDAMHEDCGSFGSDLLESFDGSKWEICAKCGEELREISYER